MKCFEKEKKGSIEASKNMKPKKYCCRKFMISINKYMAIDV